MVGNLQKVAAQALSPSQYWRIRLVFGVTREQYSCTLIVEAHDHRTVVEAGERMAGRFDERGRWMENERSDSTEAAQTVAGCHAVVAYPSPFHKVAQVARHSRFSKLTAVDVVADLQLLQHRHQTADVVIVGVRCQHHINSSNA